MGGLFSSIFSWKSKFSSQSPYSSTSCLQNLLKIFCCKFYLYLLHISEYIYGFLCNISLLWCIYSLATSWSRIDSLWCSFGFEFAVFLIELTMILMLINYVVNWLLIIAFSPWTYITHWLLWLDPPVKWVIIQCNLPLSIMPNETPTGIRVNNKYEFHGSVRKTGE